MEITITPQSHPALHMSFSEIRRDNMAGFARAETALETLTQDVFIVPADFAGLAGKAEAGLSRLLADDIEAWTGFLFGDTLAAGETAQRRGDLHEAEILLTAFFNNWPSSGDRNEETLAAKSQVAP